MIPETLGRLRDSDRAVSPVIGVILMVAITVILAAVIAAFVLGFGADQESAPTATVEMQADWDAGEEVNIVHEGGDSFSLENVYLRGDSVDNDGPLDPDGELQGGESIGSGDASFSGPPEEGEELRLVWEVGDESAILATAEWDIISTA